MRSIAEILGINVAKYREKEGLTQDQLAKKIGATRVSINRIEKGKAWPSLATVEEIARMLCVDASALFKDPAKDPIQWAIDDISAELRSTEAVRAQWVSRRETILATKHELVAKLADAEVRQLDKSIQTSDMLIASKKRIIAELRAQYPELKEKPEQPAELETLRSLVAEQAARIRTLEAIILAADQPQKTAARSPETEAALKKGKDLLVRPRPRKPESEEK